MGIFSSLLLLASAQPTAEPLPSEIHNFQDWAVTCDNGLRCQAISLVPEPSPAELEAAQMTVGTPAQPAVDPWDRFGIMTFERGPAAGDELAITLSDFEGTPAQLFKYDEVLDVRFTQLEEGDWRVVPANHKSFAEQLYSGELVVKDAAGKTLTAIALDGAWGALIYMDERQGRLRTPTSLLRPGERPVSVIPAPPALPVIVAAPRTSERPLNIPARRLDEVRKSLGCHSSDVGGEDGAATAALGNGRTLVLLNCGAGAYNYNSVPLIAWREGREIRIEEARLDVPRQEGVDERLRFYLTNAEWDAERRMIHEFAKGRGLGDCGVRASYVWTGQFFSLAEQAEMSVCRGSHQYLTTWRTEVR